MESVYSLFDEIHENPCAELVEVALFLPQGSTGADFLLGAETRFGTMTIALDDQEQYVEFGLAKATLRLRLSGCRIEPGNRLFDKTPVREISTNVRSHREIATETKTKHGVGGSVSGSVASTGQADGKLALDIGAGAKLENTDISQQLHEQNIILTKQPILSVAGNRWEFSAIDDKLLISKYMGDEPLCKITVSSPDFKVIAEGYFFARDIVILDGQAKGGGFLEFFSKSPNKAAIAKVLLAKHLKKVNEDKPTGGVAGSITAARSLIRGTSKPDGKS